MKAKPVLRQNNAWSPCPVANATHVTLNFPGPTGELTLPIILRGTRAGTGCWTWNGDTEKPTRRPSVLSNMGRDGKIVCHSWVNDGKAQFLPDSTHEFSGQTVDLLDI